MDLFLKTPEVGFDPAAPRINQHEWISKATVSSYDDNIIADAISAWIVGGDRIRMPGSYVDYLGKHVEANTSFRPRLRRRVYVL